MDRVTVNFVPKFVATATEVVKEKMYMTSSNSPGRKIKGRQTARNYLYRGRVIVNFVPKFVAMATRVVRRKIGMTPSNSPGLKIEG